MQPTLSPKPTDDPCDDVETVSDAFQIAPSDAELSSVLQQAARHRLAAQAPATADVGHDPALPSVDPTIRSPSADDERSSQQATARPTAPPIEVADRLAPANDDRAFGHQGSWARRAIHAFIVTLLAVGIGVAAAAWKSYGAAATKMIATLATQFVVGSSESERSAVAAEPAPPAVPAQASNAVSGQPAPAAQTAPAADATAPAAPAAPDQTQLLQSMTRDLATLQQQVEELKSGMEQLKASQQQMSRDVAKAAESKVSEIKASDAKASEQKPRPRTTTTAATPTAAPTPARSAVQARRPVQSFASPQVPAAAAAPQGQPPYQAPSPYYGQPQRYVPPQPDPLPQATTRPSIDDDGWVPRPPLPVR